MEIKNVLAILFSLVVAAVSSPAHLQSIQTVTGGRVVGGTDAKDHEYPHIVSIQNNSPTAKGHFCGGSLVAPQFVLTAAHCLDSKLAANIAILAGTNSLSEGGVLIAGLEIFIHPEFSRVHMLHDIALLKLAEPVQLGDTIQLIELPEEDHEDPIDVVLIGWGYTNTSVSKVPDRLQEVHLTTITTAECDARVVNSTWRVEKSHVCTLHEELGFGACQGDSGGSLIRNVNNVNNVKNVNKDRRIVGVVSWGYPCAVGYPDVYTRVYTHKEWIVVTKDNNSD